MKISSSKTISSLAIAGLVLALAPATQAADIELGNSLVPGSLGVGDKFQLVFVSSTTRDATSNDIADYDTHVQTAANGATLDLSGYTWKAIVGLNVPLYHFRDNVSVNEAVYLVDNTKVADAGDFYEQDLDAAMNIDENGGTYIGSVWTGMSWEGFRTNGGLGTDGGFIPGGESEKFSDAGLSDETGPTWAQGTIAVQTTSLPFYAMSEVLTVVESSTGPSTLAITSIVKSGTTVTVEFAGGTDGETYDLNKASSLDGTFPDNPDSTPDSTTLSGTTTGTLTDTGATEDADFYQVKQQP